MAIRNGKCIDCGAAATHVERELFVYVANHANPRTGSPCNEELLFAKAPGEHLMESCSACAEPAASFCFAGTRGMFVAVCSRRCELAATKRAA